MLRSWFKKLIKKIIRVFFLLIAYATYLNLQLLYNNSIYTCKRMNAHTYIYTYKICLKNTTLIGHLEGRNMLARIVKM